MYIHMYCISVTMATVTGGGGGGEKKGKKKKDDTIGALQESLSC